MRGHYRITNKILRKFNTKVYIKVVISAKNRVYIHKGVFLRKLLNTVGSEVYTNDLDQWSAAPRKRNTNTFGYSHVHSAKTLWKERK